MGLGQLQNTTVEAPRLKTLVQFRATPQHTRIFSRLIPSALLLSLGFCTSQRFLVKTEDSEVPDWLSGSGIIEQSCALLATSFNYDMLYSWTARRSAPRTLDSAS